MKHLTTNAMGLNQKRGFVDSLLETIKKTAKAMGKQDLIFDLEKSVSRMRKEKDKSKARQFTFFRLSKAAKVDLRINIDTDKQYFIDEFLKIMCFAEDYYRLGKWLAFYNSGLVLAFIAIQTLHYTLATKVYSMFG